VARIKEDLNEGTEVYSYSITPKNLAQRVSIGADTRDAIQAMINTNLNIQERNDINALIQKLQERSRQSLAIQTHPIVVGFGKAEARRKWRKRDRTEFGWVVAPQIQFGQDRRAQTDRQYSLAAVVSVPSWWRSVNLSIRTCWIDRQELHDRRKVDGCGSARNSDRIAGSTLHSVRLPGAINELSRKLGFDVIQQPHISDRKGPITIEIGRPANVLLMGGRLWRSTEVTLGAQRADRITVLPNMDGIIATFNCIWRTGQPPAGPGVPPPPVDIRVWTSEGVTESQPAALVEPLDATPNLPQQTGPQQQSTVKTLIEQARAGQAKKGPADKDLRELPQSTTATTDNAVAPRKPVDPLDRLCPDQRRVLGMPTEVRKPEPPEPKKPDPVTWAIVPGWLPGVVSGAQTVANPPSQR
jgi:hypothetical protein